MIHWRYFLRNIAMGLSAFAFFGILALLWFYEWNTFGFIMLVVTGLTFIVTYATPYEDDDADG